MSNPYRSAWDDPERVDLADGGCGHGGVGDHGDWPVVCDDPEPQQRRRRCDSFKTAAALNKLRAEIEIDSDPTPVTGNRTPKAVTPNMLGKPS